MGEFNVSQESDSSSQFEFTGGVLCLDFCNTANDDVIGDWTEHLVTYADLAVWGEESGILDHDEADRLKRQAAQNPDEAAAVLQHAYNLRASLYDIFAAVAHERTPNLNALDAEWERIGSHLRVVPAENGFKWGWAGDSLDKMLWPVVWSASDLLTSDSLNFVRQCSGPTCSWLFLDTSRNHSRRWCDMKACGNRAKAHRHYHRSKADL